MHSVLVKSLNVSFSMQGFGLSFTLDSNLSDGLCCYFTISYFPKYEKNETAEFIIFCAYHLLWTLPITFWRTENTTTTRFFINFYRFYNSNGIHSRRLRHFITCLSCAINNQKYIGNGNFRKINSEQKKKMKGNEHTKRFSTVHS